MWPFKKNKSLEEIHDQEHEWSVLQAQNESGPMIVRINNSARDWKSHPNLNIRVGFAIPLKSPNPGGLPEPEENERLGQVEDFLNDLMINTGPALQVLAITTGTFKEFSFYINNGPAIEAAHKEAKSTFKDLDIQCYGEHDPKWHVYSDWSRA